MSTECLVYLYRERKGLSTDGRGAHSHSDAHLVVWELMKMLWLVEQVRPYYYDGVLDRSTPLPSSTQGVDADKNNRGTLKSATAVFFGIFGAEETLLLSKKKPLENIITSLAVPKTKEGNVSVAAFFDYIFNYSGRPNHIEEAGSPVLPLKLKFIGYFL